MPFLFGIIGLVLIVSGVRGTVAGTNPNLVSLVQQDLTGKPNYIEWMFAIGVIGAIGYIDSLKTLSRAFMTLVVVVLIIDNREFFVQLTNSVQQISQNSNPQPDSQLSPPSTLTKMEDSLTHAFDSLSDDNIFKSIGL